MAKVKLTIGRSGSRGSFKPGDEYECEDHVAENLIKAGKAVAIKKAPAKKAAAPKAEEQSSVTPDETRG